MKPSEIKHKIDTRITTDNSQVIATLQERIKELESLLESKATYVCDEHLVKRIKELEEKNNELKHINSLIKRDYEKKDKEIESYQKRIETYEAMIKSLETKG